MTHAHKKNLPEDQDRLNPLHDRACQYLAAQAKTYSPIQAVCEKELFSWIHDFRRGQIPGVTIKGYVDVWLQFRLPEGTVRADSHGTYYDDSESLAIEVKSAPVLMSEILRQILYYRNSCTGTGYDAARARWILVTLYPLEPSNGEMLAERHIEHLELSPDVVNAWWAEKNR